MHWEDRAMGLSADFPPLLECEGGKRRSTLCSLLGSPLQSASC